MKVGFVAVVGSPNVGKSSLINKIIDYDLSIVSKMAQTTRNLIKGIYNDSDSQIIFLDTPGIHKAENKLGKLMNKIALNAMNNDCDLTLYLVSCKNNFILPNIKFNFEKTIVVITKIDLLKTDQELEEKVKQIKSFGFLHVLAVSIYISESLKIFLNTIKEFLTENKPYYDVESISDISTIFLIEENIRLSIIKNIKDEIPHRVAVKVEDYIPIEITKNKINVKCLIYCSKESQKGIIIGQKGQMIRNIKKQSLENIEKVLNEKINLNLKVKVNKKWINDETKVKKLLFTK